MRLSRVTTLALALTWVSAPALMIAQDSTVQTQPDNTKINKRDRASGAVTADNQKNNKSDRDLTQKIRKAIVEDKSLSTYAHNVKVITRDGTVTLKGPVRSDDEKSSIVSKAADIAGKANVKDEMSVKASTEADR